ncbi:hypothetical protein CDAR_103621 [Caerostris darwini]|uniref:Uncharacterized protein n=1 Tax=Caerostris darwini TaxID=1538125 RepID=A0AAV4PJH3_9ARAC|nr:hypothetical protein CDAR_103621 [Caerostris darwini]
MGGYADFFNATLKCVASEKTLRPFCLTGRNGPQKVIVERASKKTFKDNYTTFVCQERKLRIIPLPESGARRFTKLVMRAVTADNVACLYLYRGFSCWLRMLPLG